MSESIVYVDKAEVRGGKFTALKAAMEELALFVEANEPALIAYNVYFSEDTSRMTVIHIHRDAASLEHHMRVAGPLFPKFADFVRLLSIDVYGQPTDHALMLLRQKAEALGTGTVEVYRTHAGFMHVKEKV